MNSILAIETSTAACSVALSYKGQIFHIFEMLPQRHAHRVLEMVDEVLKQADATDADIDYLAYGEGPGAFTGIRIATGVVQGLALGWSKPVIAVSSLEAMAFAGLQSLDIFTGTDPVEWVTLMDARMKEIYWQSGTYDPSNNEWMAQEPELLTEDVIKNRLMLDARQVFGDIQNAYPEFAGSISGWHESLPTAKAVVELADEKYQTAELISEHVPLPVYLRNNVAETIAQRQAKKVNV